MYSSQGAVAKFLPNTKCLSHSSSDGISQVGLMQDSSRHSVCSDNMNMDSSASGLLRYRSAPSSFLASLVEEADDYLPRVAGSEEPDHAVIARYFSGDSSSLTSESSSGVIQPTGSDRSAAAAVKKEQSVFKGRSEEGGVGKQPLASIMENGGPEVVSSRNGFCSSHMMMGYRQQGQGQDPRSGMEDSYRVGNPNPVCLGSSPLERANSGMPPSSASSSGGKSSLTRHSSSPAGFLSRLSGVDGHGMYENGYLGAVRGMSGFPNENRSCDDIVAPNRLASNMSFMKQGSSTAVLSSQLSDMGIPEAVDKLNMPPVGSSGETLGGSSSDEGSLGDANRVQRYMTGFSVGSWDDTSIVSESFAGMHNGAVFSGRKRPREMNGKIMSHMSVTESQKGEASSHLPSALTHQFSLPKSSTEIAMEKLLQDSVPCKIRAKRGCATHPRSIAERVRRTRISERMRKLQELVPNMDKQTNTADMLDEAVEYIKFLRKEVQELSEKQSNCTCSSKQASENT